MAITFSGLTAGLTRDGSYLSPSADWSLLLWDAMPSVTATPNVIYVFGDAAFANPYIALKYESDGLYVKAYNGTSTVNTTHAAIDFSIYRSIALVYTAGTTTLDVLLNGESVHTVSLDVSLATFIETDEVLSTATAGNTTAGQVLFNVRTWQAALTATELTSEAFLDAAGITTNLLTDTPLTTAADLNDMSGNGHDWTNLSTAGTTVVSPTLIPSPPTNTGTDALNAIALGDLPKTIIQNVRDGGTDKTVWFSVDALAAQQAIGPFAFGTTGGYVCRLSAFNGTAASPSFLSIAANNLPVQIGVITETYYLRCAPLDATQHPAVLVLNVQAAPQLNVPIGSIFVSPVVDRGVGVASSATADYTPLRCAYPIASGSEDGDILSTGTFLLGDALTVDLKLYDKNFALLDTFSTSSTHNPIRLCRGVDVLYVATQANPVTVRTIGTTGSISSVVATLTANTTISAVAAANDESLLYFTNASTNVAIKVWDLNTDMAAADLVAGVANYQVTDILVLDDDTLIVCYFKPSATLDVVVKAFSDVGALLHTYSFGSDNTSVSPRLAYAIDSPNSFWIMTHPKITGVATGKSLFQNIKVSDGSVLAARTIVEFGSSAYSAAATSNPLNRFGNNDSCPFFLTRAGITPPVTTTTFTIRRQRRFLLPSSPDNKRMSIPTLELLAQGGVGLTPAAYDGANVPQGANPQVMLRISKDGGKTWAPERWVSAGTMGRYLTRFRWLQATGTYRNAVCEITVDDPVDWQMIAMSGDPVEGSS